MSYILDALRRSQAERDRGQVPGLNTQAAPALPLPSPAQRPAALWAGVALALLVVLGLGVLWLRPAPPPGGAAALTPAAPQAAAMPLPSPVTGQRPAEQTPMQTPAQVSAQATAQATAQAPTPNLPQVVSAPPVGLPSTPTPTAAAAAPMAPLHAASPAPSPSPGASPPPAPSAEPRPVPLAQLGAQQRQELPPMSFGGSIWSDSAANRFVIVNGQVVREGEQAAPGVTLERIGPKAAILRWRDLRIEVPF